MHIETSAKVNSDYSIVIDEIYKKLLKPGMKIHVIIDNDDISEKKKALDYVLNIAKKSSPGIKNNEITREWIHEK